MGLSRCQEGWVGLGFEGKSKNNRCKFGDKVRRCVREAKRKGKKSVFARSLDKGEDSESNITAEKSRLTQKKAPKQA
jgi:hypothetical protein